MNTLRGVFPEPPPAPRRNFIKENMLQIKRMQGYIVNDAGDHISYRKQNKQRENDATQKTMKLLQSTKKKLNNLSQISANAAANQQQQPKIIQTNISSTLSNRLSTNKHSYNTDYTYNPKTAVEAFNSKRFKEIGVQTDITKDSFEPVKTNDVKVIKSPRNFGDGDRMKRQQIQTIDDNHEKKDYVKENAQIKPSIIRGQSQSDPTKAPPTYQKGVVPKYLRERKDEIFKQTISPMVVDERCPEGHVSLPDNERKETLRMLRQSYSELVSELNHLPVRSDTLKIRNRKIEIENQLKKLDEGIKVFTRPKVYVKIGA